MEKADRHRACPVAETGNQLDLLLERVYCELRQIARFHHLNERSDLTLQTTALVHEAWLRLAEGDPAVRPRDDRHLKALTSRIIRRLLVDEARRRKAQKRTPLGAETEEPGNELFNPPLKVDLLDLDAALNQLSGNDPRLARIVEMRFFGGFTAEQTAQSLNVSTRTVERDWLKARAYLLQLLDPAPAATHHAG